MRTLGLAALMAVLFFALPGGASSPAGATTCSMRSEPDPWKRVESAASWADSRTELVVVGEVVRERRTEWTPEGYRELNYDDTAIHGAYWSLVRVDAVLAGSAPDGDIGLPARYMVWQCIGGPRLREGDRVLLFVYRDRFLEEYPEGYNWNTALLGGQIVFRDGEAYLTDYQAADYEALSGLEHVQGEHLGGAAEVVARVAALLGTSAVDTAAAQEAAARPSRSAPPGSPAVVVAAIVSTALLAGLGTALVRRRVRGDSSHGL